MNIQKLKQRPEPMMPKNPLHKELSWWRADNGAVGVIIEDQVDKDYSWVVLTRHPDMWRAVDLGHSHHTAADAIKSMNIALETAFNDE